MRTVRIIERNSAERRKEFRKETPYDNRFGFWGVVTEVHPEDCTVHVRMDTGHILSGVRVASLEWVTVSQGKHLTGERHMPPVDTYVFCLMPNGELSSAFVLCSGFTRSQAVHADFKKEGEDAANIHEKVENSGWVETTDYRTGTKKIQNRAENPTVSIEVNQESAGDDKVTVSVNGTELTIDKDGTVDIKAAKIITDTSNMTDLKGAVVRIGGSVTPNGRGALCGVPYCIFSGAPHSGDSAIGETE